MVIAKISKTVSPVLEEPDVEIDGVKYPPNYGNPNPNDELDNLYLDMNGIVHPCTHPEGREAPKNEDEMMLEVFKYTDRVLTMARPRKILMIAIDGVAPRAKMNQQRSRRFRTARESRINAEAKEQAINEAEARGETIDDAIKVKLTGIPMSSHLEHPLWIHLLLVCAIGLLTSLTQILVGVTLKLLFQMLLFQERVNTKLWNSFVLSALIPLMTLIPPIVFMDWMLT